MRRLHRNNKQTHVGCKRIIRIIINGIIIAKMCWYRMFGITLPLASHNRILLRWKTEWWAMSLSVFSCWRTLTHAHRRSPQKEKNRTFYGVYFLHCVSKLWRECRVYLFDVRTLMWKFPKNLIEWLWVYVRGLAMGLLKWNVQQPVDVR